jgi:hypothetical protein
VIWRVPVRAVELTNVHTMVAPTPGVNGLAGRDTADDVAFTTFLSRVFITC